MDGRRERFASATPYVPGVVDETSFIRDIVNALFETAENAGARLTMTRRLFFESYSLAASDMKRRIERTDEDPPSKVPRAERESRIEAIKKRLVGRDFSDLNEPGPSVIDFFNQCADDGVLKFLGWGKIVSFKQEAECTKQNTEWKADKTGVVRARTAFELPTATAADKHALRQLLTRRGVAMEVGRVLSFEAHEVWVLEVFRWLDDVPAEPDRFEATTISQVHKADREIFRVVSDQTRGGVSVDGAGKFPI